ncbi:hypothetical protein B0H16DRAFT_1570746 [Mycena metata]|uniref:Uncharacterized protein n=1 Tax=Mycena metata TaxID=1033252 RepID=A0AAD7IAF6_9AGAR|nr:hypothetical protein B0H16DRAFT_1570746 [Mycena metata]
MKTPHRSSLASRLVPLAMATTPIRTKFQLPSPTSQLVAPTTTFQRILSSRVAPVPSAGLQRNRVVMTRRMWIP